MARYTHVTSGARVSVRDDKIMDSSWKPDVADGGTADDGTRTDKTAVDYDAMKVPDLRAEIARRNVDRDEADWLPSDGRKPDLVAALHADDDAHAEQ